ncbi:MAG: NnrU family protein [Pseudomonadota bacterium]
MIAGLIVFFSAHGYSAVTAGNPGGALKARLGAARYWAFHSLFSIAGLALIVWGYNLSRSSSALYITPFAIRWVSVGCLALAFICLAATFTPPGAIKSWLKSPANAAVALWAFAHLLYGGDATTLLLFGSFFVYGVVGTAVAIRQKPAGDVKVSVKGDSLAIVFGLAFFALFIKGLHFWLLGIVPNLPF